MIKCPNCNKELKQLKGEHKFAVQIESQDNSQQESKDLANPYLADGRKPKITDFNRDMTKEERDYYGEEFDENR